MTRELTSESHPQVLDFLPRKLIGLGGRIGMTSAPGRVDAHAAEGNMRRHLDTDLLRLRNYYRVDVLVTLLERGQYVTDEFALLEIRELLVRAQHHGMRTEWSPTPDGGVPVSLSQLVALVEHILMWVRDGRRVAIHCREGLGRTGLVTCACLCALGASVDEALESVRALRPGSVETAAQLQCLRAFDELWRKRTLQRAQSGAISDVFGSSESSSAELQRISQSGLAPFSRPGAATIVYLGLEQEAAVAGVTDGSPLREGDVFHVMPSRGVAMGRGHECDISVPSRQLSRVHALLAFAPVAQGKLVLVDLDSLNGTWVGESQKKVHFLALGEEFALAKAYRFRFESIG
jgi:protein-tyrosine phosphatase